VDGISFLLDAALPTHLPCNIRTAIGHDRAARRLRTMSRDGSTLGRRSTSRLTPEPPAVPQPAYRYLGDRQTASTYVAATCDAVRRPDGKTIRGANGAMLVTFDGVPVVVLGRRLRRLDRS
jgi:hypothetical protein